MKFSTFLLNILKIGCLGFGGGSALIPIFEDLFIGKGKLDTKENFDKDIIVASLTPGALPIEIAASIGKRNYGKKGMILGGVMMALPGILASLLLVTLLSTLQDKIAPVVKCLTVGVSAFIIYLLLNYVKSVFVENKNKNKVRLQRSVVIMIAVFVLSGGKNLLKLFDITSNYIISVSTVYILLTAFFLIICIKATDNKILQIVSLIISGIYLFEHGGYEHKYISEITFCVDVAMILMVLIFTVSRIKCFHKNNLKIKETLSDLGCWVAFLLLIISPIIIMDLQSFVFVFRSIISVLMSFGGGDAYLVIADGLFVDDMVSEDTFYNNIVSVVNILPGSILGKTLSCVGYYYGINEFNGYLGSALSAIAGGGIAIGVSCGVCQMFYSLYEEFSASKVCQTLGNYIRAIIGGLLGNVILVLFRQSKNTAITYQIPMTAIFSLLIGSVVLNHILSEKFKVSNTIIVIVDILISCLLFCFI